jgi:hypothetical protein
MNCFGNLYEPLNRHITHCIIMLYLKKLGITDVDWLYIIMGQFR